MNIDFNSIDVLNKSKCSVFFKKKRIFISIPFFIARIMAFFINLIGLNIITRDQVKLLKYDNIHHKSKEVLGFADLNIVPKNIEEIVPTYLKRFSK